MAKQDGFPAVFAQLKWLLEPHADNLVVTADEPGNYALDAPASPAYPAGLFFGGVQVKKNYASFHLMPVYVFPDLLDGVPDRLCKRMQGKSCFNFATLDDETVADLTRLTATGYERYCQAGFVPRLDPKD